MIDFSNLINALGCSPQIQKSVKTIDVSLIHTYGDRSCLPVKQKIARWLHVSADQITMGNGSDELIDLVPRVFLNPGVKVVTQVPTFFRVIESCLKQKSNIVTVSTKEHDKFSFTEEFCERMLKTIKKHRPKIIWLCSPCNPTGEIIPIRMIDKIASFTEELVVIDEVYQELFDPDNRVSAVQLLAKHKNILVLKSFSKGFGLAGLRVGFAIASRDIIAPLDKLRLNFNVSVLSQKIAELALTDTEFLKQGSLFFDKERKWLFNEIHKLENIVIGAESKVNVFIIKHKHKDLFQRLVHQNVLTADFQNAVGLEGMGFVRVTIKTHKENVALLKALTKINNSML